MSDYIDDYRVALKSEFSSTSDKDARKAFWENARSDIEWAKAKGLIGHMSMEDYLKTKYKTKNYVSDTDRKVIEKADFIPSKILALFYGISPCTVRNIQRDYRRKTEEEDSTSELEAKHTDSK
jgi:hypothetical protein